EMILLSTRGTAAAPIRVNGVPGPQGQLPVIDGQNAVMSSQLHYAYAGTAARGLITISPPAGYTWGFKPGYIDISGLDIRDANPSNSYTDSSGVTHPYATDAASIFVERGEHITIHGCTITGSANGLFVASGDSEEVQSRDILVDGNSIYGNGLPGRDQ